jgi:hypothetical protein
MDLNRRFMNRLFRHVDNVVWDLMSGRVGFQTADGIVTIELGDVTDSEAPDAVVSVNLLDEFGISIPAFAQSVPTESITLGDLIFGATGPLGWVVKKNEKSFRLMKPDGTRTDWHPPKTQMIGFESGVMVLRNLLNMFPNGAGDLGKFQGTMMPFLMMGMGGDSDLKDMLPLMLMSQATGGDGSSNMLQTMMMMKMMGGNGFNLGDNGKGGFFDRK